MKPKDAESDAQILLPDQLTQATKAYGQALRRVSDARRRLRRVERDVAVAWRRHGKELSEEEAQMRAGLSID